MDSTTLLTLAIVALSAVLVGVGVYAVVLMRQLQKNLGKLEKILDHVESITTNIDDHIVKPSSSLAGVLAMLREGSQIVEEIRHFTTDTAAAAKVINSEAKEVAEVVRHDIAPTVAQEIRETVHEVAPEIRATVNAAVTDVAAAATTAAPPVEEVARTAPEEARETVDQIHHGPDSIKEPAGESSPTWHDLKQTMEARSYHTSPQSRRFFRRH